MRLAISFPNFGPYHLARLRALAGVVADAGGALVAYETAGVEQRYPWLPPRGSEPFEWHCLFPDQSVEELAPEACARRISLRLERDRPDAVCVVGYVRPESLALLRWARREGRPAILLSESQAVDRPRVWWKEAVKRQRVRLFDAALVGGASHRDYLVDLGMRRDRIALGYNAVDNDAITELAARSRGRSDGGPLGSSRPYFLSVCRFAPEKNVPGLIRAFGRYRAAASPEDAWDLVLCGDGPDRAIIAGAIEDSGCGQAIHLPGFQQSEELVPWYAWARAFVLASVSEPWGLVVNEAAVCGLPLLVSNRAGAAGTLVPDPPGQAGWQFDPRDVEALAGLLARMSDLSAEDRLEMGKAARRLVACWGPERFAIGVMDALDRARVRGHGALTVQPAGEQAR